MKRIKKLWNMENSGLLEIFFKGLADVSRLRILSLLLHGELCGCDIQYVLDASQSNVSRHLTYLKNSGLVLDRRSGYRVTTASPLSFPPTTGCYLIIWNALFGGRGCSPKI